MSEPMEFTGYDVYVKPDEAGRITAINSSAFLSDADGWVKIDYGVSDKFHHAQGNYFPKPIMDERDIYRYKLVDGAVVERTQDEMDADWVEPEVQSRETDRITALEDKTASYEIAYMEGVQDA